MPRSGGGLKIWDLEILPYFDFVAAGGSHVSQTHVLFIILMHFVFQPMWVYDGDAEQMVLRDITFVPGLYKIFDEILGMHDKEISVV